MSFIARSFVKQKKITVRTSQRSAEVVEFGSGQISEDLSIGKCEEKKVSNALKFIYLCVECQKEEREKKSYRTV